MPHADLANVRLYYDLSGPADGEPLVLIQGLGAQSITWPPGFVALLQAERFRVILFDNRDVGLSTWFDDASEQPYVLADMSDDVAHLLDHLGIRKAHVVGQSMGGMIAQQFAIDHQDRTLSLISIYSAPVAAPEFLVQAAAVSAARNSPWPADREGAIQRYIAQEMISGLEEYDDEWIRAYAERVIDRAYNPPGQERQMAALRGAPDRRPGLAAVTVPAAVIHGRNDPLVSFRGGIATAVALPNAELHVFTEMAHQVKPSYWPDYVRIIARTAARARGGACAGTKG